MHQRGKHSEFPRKRHRSATHHRQTYGKQSKNTKKNKVKFTRLALRRRWANMAGNQQNQLRTTTTTRSVQMAYVVRDCEENSHNATFRHALIWLHVAKMVDWSSLYANMNAEGFLLISATCQVSMRCCLLTISTNAYMLQVHFSSTTSWWSDSAVNLTFVETTATP